MHYQILKPGSYPKEGDEYWDEAARKWKKIIRLFDLPIPENVQARRPAPSKRYHPKYFDPSVIKIVDYGS